VKTEAIYINKDYCKGCGLCVANCPAGVLGLSKELTGRGIYPAQVVNLEACTGCKLCEQYCPDFAIAVELRGEYVDTETG
jgi:2-oxoglutarate ferredoxin oxidoreductase subunit delta